ncbi:hypothetical protein TWF173_009089 [Orbilia oligospora]|nr:hypothetical protein TWF173_009089 [Orbilia oligospora]
MTFLVLLTALGVLTTSASGLIIDLIQSVPGKDLPTLRLCRPPIEGLVNSPPAINPLKTSCPVGSSVFWLWNYNSQPSDNMQTLINLLGVTQNSRETPYMLSEVAYDTPFSYGFTNPGLRYQPSVFKVKRGGEYQAIDSNNPFQEGDELEYFSPTINNDDDKNLRIRSENRKPPVLTRQLTDSSGAAFESTKLYPTVTLKINSLGNTELVLPKGNWLQQGAQGLTNVANTLKSGLNTFVAQPLTNAATYISKNTPQWQENAKAWIGKTGNNLYNTAGAVLNNGVNYIAQPLANAGGWVDTKVTNGINRAGNALNGAVNYVAAPFIAGGEWVDAQVDNGINRVQNAINNAVDYAAAPFVAGGKWVENTGTNYITQPIARAGQWIGNTATNAYNTAIQDLNGVGGALGQGWQAAKDVTNLGLANAGNWARGQINNGLQTVGQWVNGYPVLQSGGVTGQVVQPMPSYIPTAAFPVQSGSPAANQADSNALPIVAPQEQNLGGSATGATLRTGGEYETADEYPWDMSASQFFVPGKVKI